MLAPPAPLPPAPNRRTRAHWGVRLRDTLSTYLPLLLMVLLALATWWLARNAPQPEPAPRERPPRSEPDATMQGVLLQRFDADGRLRVEVRGDAMHHFPDNDTVEVDHVRIRAWSRDDRETVASALKARATSNASELRLEGGARVKSDAVERPRNGAARAGESTAAGAETIEFESEFLHLLVDQREVRTHLPVTLRSGTNEVRAAGLEYTHEPPVLRLQGPLHAVMQAELRSGARAAR